MQVSVTVNVYASPVAAAGRVYITGRNGTTLVLKRSSELEVLATNKLDDTINASPALAGGPVVSSWKQVSLLHPAAAMSTSEEPSRWNSNSRFRVEHC